MNKEKKIKELEREDELIKRLKGMEQKELLIFIAMQLVELNNTLTLYNLKHMKKKIKTATELRILKDNKIKTIICQKRKKK